MSDKKKVKDDFATQHIKQSDANKKAVDNLDVDKSKHLEKVKRWYKDAS
jgi:hypothetical protein